MKFGYKTLCTAAALAMLALPAKAHMLWINVVPEAGYQVISSLAFGDVYSSGSELLTPDWWPVEVAEYDVIDPNGKHTALGVPELVTKEKQLLSSGLKFQVGGDTGQRKFSVTDEAVKGTYQLSARTPLNHVVSYEDEAGNMVYVNTNRDRLPDGIKVSGEGYNVLFAKAVFTAGKWSDPAPLGLPLEIVPLSDLHEAGAGDKVRFQVLINGKPYTKEAHIYAYNASFGDRWGLVSELKAGEGEFRLPVSGPWRIHVEYEGKSHDFDAYKNKKDMLIIMKSSLVFNASP